jgi:tRNA threonylcarbamoyladenosine biosynthesis protein TsaB
MSLILHIDTATEHAHVSISKNGLVLQSLLNNAQKDHAAFLQVGIQQIAKTLKIPLTGMDAIAVTAGPGSYTGLRIGMSSAKGLCYALKKPLIVLNTLEVLTTAAIQQSSAGPEILFCPMIDARRMEVFTAVYNKTLHPMLLPCAMVLDVTSFNNLLSQYQICFFGNGAVKWQAINIHSNALFTAVSNLIEATALLAQQHFIQNQFADLAYSEPFYIKEFQDKI